MGKRITWGANALICLIIVLGFAVATYVSYHSNRAVFEKVAERMSVFASEGISREIDAQLAKPINVSLTMANDLLLKNFLAEEGARGNEADYVETMRAYLDAYRGEYGFDSAFLVSAETGRYYHFNGIDRMIAPDNPENTWYYAFLEDDGEYALNIDNDEATGNEITVFTNARIPDDAGGTRGVVGVGFRLNDLQQLLAGYERRTDTKAYLIDAEGEVQIAVDGAEGMGNLFEANGYPGLREKILSNRTDVQDFWYTAEGKDGFIVAHYVPDLDWFLVVDHDTAALEAQASRQLAVAIAIMAAVILLVLVATTSIFHRYNRLIVRKTMESEQGHKTIFQEAAEQLYDNIYEIDLTHDCAASEETDQYFASLGVPKGTPYDEALAVIAEKQVKKEFRQGYLDTFCTESALTAFRAGKDSLTYDFMMTEDGAVWYWMRINAHLFYWDEDDSVRMLVYRQNIDDEKQHERYMIEQMQRDSLTGLYNKAATQEHIRKRLAVAPQAPSAFVILDIDDFKAVNDSLGHSAGDTVLEEFSRAVRDQFRRSDVVGRIGGDEFVAFLEMPDLAAAEKKGAELVEALKLTVETPAGTCRISASIGMALTPEAGSDFETLYRRADKALYRAKARGKACYELY